MIDISYHFPQDFLWGTATSAHQVEGNNCDNDWWHWEQQPDNRIYANQLSGSAADWWAGRAEEDIARMAELNTNTHRLSVEWSRIEPKPGIWSQDAVHRYREILSAMQRAGIRPMVTLHHFTNPWWLSEMGSWNNPDAVGYFRRFVEYTTRAFSDVCDLWCTINEPNVYAAHAFLFANCPPARQSLSAYNQAVYQLAQAHAAAYEAIHTVQPHASVGLAMHMVVWRPRHSWNPIDHQVASLMDRGFNALLLDALAYGRWRPPFGRQLVPLVLKALWTGSA